ncbi:MAG: right-handed parallel beta-helix repeat-containing protein [Opitutaceae bacterium]|nr:right-handed parallel beta-helix repeat-containing protein [Opitutaceae bacterium]
MRDRIFSPWRRGLSYIHVIGFTFGHCANQGAFPQGGAVSPRSGSHWLISGNTIRFARTIGLDVGSETWDTARLANTHPDDKRRMEGGHHIIENNIISDNGLAGIAGWHHNGVVIRDNILERNNAHDFNTGIDARWEEWGAIKLHGQGALIEGNLIRDNEAFGIWLDNDVSGSRITRNVVLNSRMAGIFIELNEGPVLIDTNIVFGTRPRGNLYDGMGIYTHDASDVTIAHNLVIENAGGGVVMRTISDRAFGGQPVESSRARILNNIVWNNSKPAIWLPFKNKRATGNVSDYNLLNAHTDLFQGYRPGQQLFGINVFKNSHTADEATAGLRDKLAAAGIPADQWPNLAWWRWQPYLSLDHWRLFTGQDRHSREPWRAVQMQVRPQEATLTALMDAPVRTMNCPRVEGVDTDFYGTPLASGKTLPGPFQNLAETRRDYILFPVLPRHTR